MQHFPSCIMVEPFMFQKTNPSNGALDPIPSNLFKPLLQQFPLFLLPHQCIPLYWVFPISLHIYFYVYFHWLKTLLILFLSPALAHSSHSLKKQHSLKGLSILVSNLAPSVPCWTYSNQRFVTIICSPNLFLSSSPLTSMVTNPIIHSQSSSSLIVNMWYDCSLFTSSKTFYLVSRTLCSPGVFFVCVFFL